MDRNDWVFVVIVRKWEQNIVFVLNTKVHPETFSWMGLWHDGSGTWPQDDARKAKKNAESLAIFEDITTIEMSLKCVKVFRVTIDDHWTTYTSIIFHHPSLFGLEKGRTIVQYFWNPPPTHKPNWKVTGDIQNPSGFWDVWDPVWNHQINHLSRGHSWAFWFHQPIPTSIWCIFSGSQKRWGTFGQLFSISSFCSNSWSNAHRRLHHPQERCNSDVGTFILLFKKCQFGSGFWWYNAIILPFICWLLDSFSHWYLDYMGYQDFHHWLKCRKTVEMRENDQGRDWDTGISLLKILCLEGYCILLPAPPTTRAHVGLGPSSMKEWVNGWMDTECIHFIAGVWPCFKVFRTSYFPLLLPRCQNLFCLFGCRGKDSTSSQGGVSVERCRRSSMCLFLITSFSFVTKKWGKLYGLSIKSVCV